MSRKGLTINVFIMLKIVVPVQLTDQLVRPHIWPLSNDTLGYDMLTDSQTARLYGHSFRSGPEQSIAYHLNGYTYVDIETEASAFDWSFVMFVYLDEGTGTLFEYFDENNQTIFVCSLLDGQATVETKKTSKTSDILARTLNLKEWFQISVGQIRSGKQFVINLGTHETLKKGFLPSEDSILEKGTLRIGRGLSASTYIKGAVYCIRRYDTVCVNHNDMEQSGGQCERKPFLETYKGPYGCMFYSCKNGAVCSDFKTINLSCCLGPYGCMFYPCKNGAVCSDFKTTNYTCSCAPGFTGIQCETEINRCDEVSCHNGGTCMSNISEYWCLCGNDFTGEHCETTIDKFQDDGYFVLRSTNRAPHSSHIIQSAVKTTSRECGVYCVQTAGCVSFTVQFQKPKVNLCYLYSDFHQPEGVLANSKYYVLRH